MFVHFIFHLVIPWLPERQYSREMDFIFKEDFFQLSIHYLYLNNNIYIIIRKATLPKIIPFYQLFIVFSILSSVSSLRVNDNNFPSQIIMDRLKSLSVKSSLVFIVTD